MNTPICDFVRQYADSDPLRLHMPGHKGRGPLGLEALDITEIAGADSLYEASGIIAQSEANASALFGCPTYYSTEGSSQCIRAMVRLALLHARRCGRSPRIAAGCNAHKTFLTAAALLDAEVVWLRPKDGDSYLSCPLTAEDLEAALVREPVAAVYLTSPDYLGSVAPIAELSAVCRRHGALLLVDNAHGAYLRFLPRSAHPMDLGADLCCDSAHKTLPVLTGGAYLHVRRWAEEEVREALALFGSTSPSYLILQSLDAANPRLETLPRELAEFLPHVQGLKDRLSRAGFPLTGDEPLKLTLRPKALGYTGYALAERLGERGIVCEFADPDHLVLMLTPGIGTEGLHRLEEALCALPKRAEIPSLPPAAVPGEQVLTPRQAMLAPAVILPVEEAVGRILSSPCVGCPPAVPIAVCGQRITAQAAAAFRYYGITHCRVVAD